MMKHRNLAGRLPVVAPFFSWWIGELAAMVPPRLRRLIVPRRDFVVVELFDSRLVMRRWGAETSAEIMRVSLSGRRQAEARALVEDAWASVGKRGSPLILLLSQDRVLRKTLSLPAAAEENLDQALRFEIDRRTPFRVDDVCFDYKVSARHKDRKRIDVDLVVAPRAVVDQAIEQSVALGLAPDIVGVAGRERENPDIFDLLPKARPTAAARWNRRLALALGLIALALLAASVYVPLERQRSLAEDLAVEAEAARNEAEGAHRLREQIDQAIDQGRLIVLKKMERPSVVQLLDEITRLLGDDTWLIRLRYVDNEVQIFGYSAAASMLIGAIEDSPLFRDAQFRAPVTRDPGIDAERFHIVFQVVSPLPRLADAAGDDEQGAGQ